LTWSQVVYTGTVRALLEMGFFEALPLDGTDLSANVLAEKLKVEKDLLSMISLICDLYSEF
jgi:hypothetical protein